MLAGDLVNSPRKTGKSTGKTMITEKQIDDNYNQAEMDWERYIKCLENLGGSTRPTGKKSQTKSRSKPDGFVFAVVASTSHKTDSA